MNVQHISHFIKNGFTLHETEVTLIYYITFTDFRLCWIYKEDNEVDAGIILPSQIRILSVNL